jgi:DNA-directed RNA polymerase specialized sigma24 family protein
MIKGVPIMGLSRQILAELPMLRRFSRAASGNQDSGDAYVEAALSNFLAMPELATHRDDLKIILYKLLLAAMRSLETIKPEKETGSTAKAAANRHLMQVPPRDRTALLLKSLEGFTLPEIARVLDCPLEEAAHLVDAGSRAIAEQLQTDVLIIEDEAMLAMDLEDLVGELGHRVIGLARTHADAVRMIARRKPGLILSDIKLADGSSGLSAVDEILTTHNVPVIFITAYPERFLKGVKPEPAFLVTKPYLPETVRALISQALFFDRRAGHSQVSAA